MDSGGDGRGGAPTEVYRRRWWVLEVLSLVLIVIGMDNLILNVALPTLARQTARHPQPAAVDRRRLHTRLRRPAVHLVGEEPARSTTGPAGRMGLERAARSRPAAGRTHPPDRLPALAVAEAEPEGAGRRGGGRGQPGPDRLRLAAGRRPCPAGGAARPGTSRRRPARRRASERPSGPDPVAAARGRWQPLASLQEGGRNRTSNERSSTDVTGGRT